MIRAFCLLGLVAAACSSPVKDFGSSVRQAVMWQMETYPESTLKDLYKNFFQDRFGPGHIIADTSAAADYLRRELASYSVVSGEAAEPIGWEHNFCRVNLSVVKEGRIPFGIFLDAFVRSVNGIEPVPVGKWKEEWMAIEAVIRSMDFDIPGYEDDRAEILERLAEGNYVGHHSAAFNGAYSPHYRIVSRKIFEEELLPLLK